MANGALGLWRSGASRTVLISYSVVSGAVWAVWVVFAVASEVRRCKVRGPGVGGVSKGLVTPVGSVTTSTSMSVAPPRDGEGRPGP